MGDSPLDRLDSQVRERYRKEQEKVDAFHTQREVERSHSRLTRPELPGIWRQRYKPELSKACTPQKTNDKIYKCEIVNCGIEFNDVELYRVHKAGNNHSPCNPLKYLKNGKLLENRSAHMCSECGVIYKDYERCMEHMNASGHNKLQLPLKLAGYICPECLSLFHDKTSCVEHMESLKHCYIQYPFKDDLEMPSGCGPVPLPGATLELFQQKCADVSYTYVCQKCYEPTADAHVHNKQRVSANMSHGEVFASLMKSHTCIQCLRLFDSICQDDLELGIHYCSDDTLGMYIDNDCKRFAEFIRRLALPTREDKSTSNDNLNLLDESFGDDGMTKLEDESKFKDPKPRTALSLKLKNLHVTDLQATTSSRSGLDADTNHIQIPIDIAPLIIQHRETSLMSSPKPVDNRLPSQMSLPKPGANNSTQSQLNVCSDKISQRTIRKARHPNSTGLRSTADLFGSITTASSTQQACRKEEGEIQRQTLMKRKPWNSKNEGTSTLKNSQVEEEDQQMDCSTCIKDNNKGGDLVSTDSTLNKAEVQANESENKLDTLSGSLLAYHSTSNAKPKQPNKLVQVDINHNTLPVAPSCSQMEAMDTKNDWSECRNTCDPDITMESSSISHAALIKREKNRRKRQRQRERKQLLLRSQQARDTQKPNTWGVASFNFSSEQTKNCPQWIPYDNTSRHIEGSGPWKPYRNYWKSDCRGVVAAETKTDLQLRSQQARDTQKPNTWGVPSFNFSSEQTKNCPQWIPYDKSSEHTVGSRPWKPYRNYWQSDCKGVVAAGTRTDVTKSRVKGSERMDTTNSCTKSLSRDQRTWSTDTRPKNRERLRIKLAPTVPSQEQIPQSPRLILSELHNMLHIIFLDLDNWASFFQKLPGYLPTKTFVWAFYGGCTAWREPLGCKAFLDSKENQCFYLHKKCSGRKDAADFAICMWIGRMDERLPKAVPFTILSGDGGFFEIEEQMKMSDRRTRVINPHHKDAHFVYALIKSVADV